MNRTRLQMLARAGVINSIVDPSAAPEGGSTQEPQEGASTTEEQAPEGEKEKSNDFETLPDWAQDQIKSLRSESARYRTAANEHKQALENAKSQEDIDAAVAEYRTRTTELEIELATTKHTAGFTPAQLALVHGSTPEEIEASAAAVREAFASHSGGSPTPPPNPDADGGSRPGGDSDAGLTPQERAKRVRERTRRR